MVEPRLGLRLVRGPDWCWGDQDGGEGFVGTAVEVGEGGRSAVVQWDVGSRGRYRCGEEDKFDLRVFDASPTGLRFPDVICSGCYVEGVAGIHWQCVYCYDYHLCHSCYLLGRHCQEHPFFRVESKEQPVRVKVSCRAGAKRVEAKGLFVGAEVVRGPHWRFGDQDGGAGSSGRVVTIEGWKTVTFRSTAMVKWSTVGQANIYRVGHQGKVDLRCTAFGSGGYYDPEHLATLGLGAAVTVFDEEEIVAGDFVKTELDPEVFKMMHEAVCLWNKGMPLVLSQSSIVFSILEEQRIYVSLSGGDQFMMRSDTVAKLKHCRVGQTVRVISDLSRLYQVQSDGHNWSDDMFTTAGQIGRVTRTYMNSTLQVYVQGRGWVFDPLCLEPAPGETAPYTPDLQNENVCQFGNSTPNETREKVKAAGFKDEALLSGDLKALERFVYNNEIEKGAQDLLLLFFAAMGMVEAVRLCLKSGISPGEVDDAFAGCILNNHVEVVTAMIEDGADVNSVSKTSAMRPLTMAAISGHFNIVKALALAPGLSLDAQESNGYTAAYCAGKFFHHKDLAVLLAAGASPTAGSHDATKSLIHERALNGSIAVMEVIVVHVRDYLNLMTPKGFAPLHLAASYGHTQVCSLLAAEVSVELNIQSTSSKSTPLHIAAKKSYWSTVECLVGWGAALNPVNSDGSTPLHMVIEAKSPVMPESSQLKQVREELLVSSGAVEGYIVVACFLVREGADWYIENKNGVSPHQALPPAMAALIAEYLRKCPGQGTFHGRLRREQQQCKLQELPLQLKLPLPSPSSAAGSTTDDSSSKAKTDSTSKGSATGAINPDMQSGLLPKDKNTDDVKKLAYSNPPVVDSQQSPDTAYPSGSVGPIPSSQFSPVQSSGVLRQLCRLCEDYPANVRFSPCGHTVLCSECAQRAKKCMQCKAYVDSKSTVTS